MGFTSESNMPFTTVMLVRGSWALEKRPSEMSVLISASIAKQKREIYLTWYFPGELEKELHSGFIYFLSLAVQDK